ncbi:MAG: nicotinate phosphoribosyltransferase [Acidobacteria bacterium]|nr:nicotinate phosphoribosyltransferase [Acidobacteriota bacterium]
MLGLATDLYQLTMAAGYLANGKTGRASFELFVRRLPPQRSWLLAAGLEQALEYLQGLSFDRAEIEYLRKLPILSGVDEKFFDYLGQFRFSGEVWAVPEGTPVFAGEPILRVTAPLIEAQIVETYLLSTINFQTLVATKAARIVGAAEGRSIVEFGARRCHGFGAALLAARAAFVGGCDGTSNVEAGYRFGLPVYGTAAHSFTQAFDEEIEAFRAFFRLFGERTTLLLDTYDTIKAARLATEFKGGLRGVRIDSGDLGTLSREVRAILDGAGMRSTTIMASGDLNEHLIADLVAGGAPIDIFGVGTELSTSRDEPALGGVYKMVEVESDSQVIPKMKLSSDKATYPYRKQVWRRSDESGQLIGDTIGLRDESLPGEELLRRVMVDGSPVGLSPGLEEIRSYAKEQVRRIPAAVRSLKSPESYPVGYSERLEMARQSLQFGLEEHYAESLEDYDGEIQ